MYIQIKSKHLGPHQCWARFMRGSLLTIGVLKTINYVKFKYGDVRNVKFYYYMTDRFKKQCRKPTASKMMSFIWHDQFWWGVCFYCRIVYFKFTQIRRRHTNIFIWHDQYYRGSCFHGSILCFFSRVPLYPSPRVWL